MASAGDSPAASPEAASLNDDQGADGSTETKSRRHTIDSLGLDYDAAVKKRTWLLFPLELRRQLKPGFGKTYPLPTSQDDLVKIAKLKIVKNSTEEASAYIRRCRKRYVGRGEKAMRVNDSIEKIEGRAYGASYRLDKQIKQMRAEAKAKMEAFRTTVAEATASLTSLYDKTRKVWEMQLDAYIDGSEVHGEKISAAGARQVAKDITGHVARIGMPSDQQDEAEDAIFEQAAKAKESTRKAVAMTLANNDDDETTH